MLMPSLASSVGCQEPCSQTAMGKKLGSVGMPLDQPAYGLVHAGCGIAGTHDDGLSMGALPSCLGAPPFSLVASGGLPGPPSRPGDDAPPPHATASVSP